MAETAAIATHAPALHKAFRVFQEQSARLEASHRQLRDQLAQAQVRLEEKNRELARRVAEVEDIKERLDGVLQSINDAVLVVDAEGAVELANTAGRRLLDEGGEVFLAHPDVARALAARRGAENIDLSVGEGSVARHFMISVLPMSDDRANLVVSVKDVTEYRQLQARVAREDRMAALGKVAASVAHEIRNPLGAIEGFARLLDRDLRDQPRAQRLAEKTVYAARQLNCVVSNLLNYTRDLRTERRRQDLRHVLDEVAEMLAPMAEDRGIRFDRDLPDTPLRLPFDAVQLRQVLVNLLVNAMDACPVRADGAVTLRARAADPIVLIEVADNGCGIPTAHLDKLFEPFFTMKEGGIGLGLAMCRRLVENHGGSVAAANNPERGATFRVELPSPPE